MWELAREALPSRATGWRPEGPNLCHSAKPWVGILELLEYEKEGNFYPASAPSHLEISVTPRQIYPRLTAAVGGSTEFGGPGPFSKAST